MPKVETKRDLSPGLPPLERIVSPSRATANNNEPQQTATTTTSTKDSNNNRTENKTTYKQQLVGKNSKVIDINDLAKPSSKTMKRLNALKNNQVKYFEAEAKYHDELHKLQSKYAHVYADIFARRKQIVSGECEPNSDECQWPLTKDESADDIKKENPNASPKSASSNENEMKKDEKSKQNDKDDEEDDEKGVSNFWLEVMLMSQTVSSLIFEQDEPALEYLQDIRVCLCEDKPASSYTLEFEFAENPYFRNRILTKTFEFNNKLDRKHPFKYHGPDLVRTIGCSIDWKPKKNLKIKVIKKKIKSRNRKVPPKIITKEETQASFFRFFDSHEIIRDFDTKKNSEKIADEKATEKAKGDEEKEISLKSNKKSTATNSSSSASSKRGDGSTESSEDSNDSDDNKKSNKSKKMSITERNNEIKRMLTETMLTMHDFTVAERLRTKLIPKAVLYMTGEIGESDMSDEEDEDDEDDDEDDDGDDSDDEHDFYEYDSEEEEDDEDEDDDQGRAWSMHPVATKLIRSNATNGSRRGFGPDDCKQS